MLMKQYKTLLFDLDGTLADTRPGIINCYDYAFSALDFDISTVNINECIGPPLEEVFDRLFGAGEKADRGVLLFRERYEKKGWLECTLFEGIPELLAALSQNGYRLLVATSKNEPIAVRVLEYYKLAGYFELIAGSVRDHKRIKKQDVITHALAETGVKAETALMIGDRMHDLLGAQLTGLDAAGVLWGYGSYEELSSYPHVLLAQSPQELLDYLLLGSA